MKSETLSIHGAKLLRSPVFDDARGSFREWFKLSELEIDGVAFPVAQANLSYSVRGTVRGLHYSLADEGQAKVVTCVAGELDDVVVDVRVGSPTFGLVEYVTLSAREGTSILMPHGVAHGFAVNAESAAMAYLLSSPYIPELELAISPFDSAIPIPWRLDVEPILSIKDAEAPTLEERRRANELPIF